MHPSSIAVLLFPSLLHYAAGMVETDSCRRMCLEVLSCEVLIEQFSVSQFSGVTTLLSSYCLHLSLSLSLQSCCHRLSLSFSLSVPGNVWAERSGRNFCSLLKALSNDCAPSCSWFPFFPFPSKFCREKKLPLCV